MNLPRKDVQAVCDLIVRLAGENGHRVSYARQPSGHIRFNDTASGIPVRLPDSSALTVPSTPRRHGKWATNAVNNAVRAGIINARQINTAKRRSAESKERELLVQLCNERERLNSRIATLERKLSVAA